MEVGSSWLHSKPLYSYWTPAVERLLYLFPLQQCAYSSCTSPMTTELKIEWPGILFVQSALEAFRSLQNYHFTIRNFHGSTRFFFPELSIISSVWNILNFRCVLVLNFMISILIFLKKIHNNYTYGYSVIFQYMYDHFLFLKLFQVRKALLGFSLGCAHFFISLPRDTVQKKCNY